MDEPQGFTRERVIQIGTRVIEEMALSGVKAVPVVGPIVGSGLAALVKEIRSVASDSTVLDQRRVLDWIADLPPEEYEKIVSTMLEQSDVAVDPKTRDDLLRNMQKDREDLGHAIDSAQTQEFLSKRIMNEFSRFVELHEGIEPAKLPPDYWKKAASYQVHLKLWGALLGTLPKLYEHFPDDPHTVETDRIATKNFNWESDPTNRMAVIPIFAFGFLFGEVGGRLLWSVGLRQSVEWFVIGMVLIFVLIAVACFIAGPWLMTKTTYPARKLLGKVITYMTFACVGLVAIEIVLELIERRITD